MFRVVWITAQCLIMFSTGRVSHTAYVEEYTPQTDPHRFARNMDVLLPPQGLRDITSYDETYIITGLFKQDTHSRVKRDLTRFQSIADDTDWTVYRRGSTDLSVLTEEINMIGTSSESIIHQFTQTTAADNTMEIPVDADVTSLNISISGPTDVVDATLTDPDGVVDTFMGGTSSRWLENNTLFMNLQNPAVGTWILTRIDTSKVWGVNITATSSIYIDFQLIQTDDSGFKTVLDRNPITGRTYTFAVIASNINATFEPLSLVLQDEEGETLITSTLTMSFTPTRNTGHTEVTMPSSNFRVQLSGLIPGGSGFIRSSWRLMTPVSADLIVYPIIGQIGSADDITYKLTNHASETKTYDVTMSSTVTSSITRSHAMLMSDTLEDTFKITTSSDFESLSYSVTLREPGTPKSLQSSSYTLQLASSLCTVFTTTNECDNANSSCSAYQWSATAVFNFEVSIFVVTTGVSITDPIADDTRLVISGNCCYFNMSLSAYGEDGHGCQVRHSTNLQEDKKMDEDSGSITYIIIGAVAAIFALGLIIVCIYKLIVLKKGNSVHSDDPSLSVPNDPFASLHHQRPTTAPVATSFTTKRFPLLEKDYLKSYHVRPTAGTGLSRPVSSRPSSGHFSLYVNSRPTSLR